MACILSRSEVTHASLFSSGLSRLREPVNQIHNVVDNAHVPQHPDKHIKLLRPSKSSVLIALLEGEL